jgi:hypothetical protein
LALVEMVLRLTQQEGQQVQILYLVLSLLLEAVEEEVMEHLLIPEHLEVLAVEGLISLAQQAVLVILHLLHHLKATTVEVV